MKLAAAVMIAAVPLAGLGQYEPAAAPPPQGEQAAPTQSAPPAQPPAPTQAPQASPPSQPYPPQAYPPQGYPPQQGYPPPQAYPQAQPYPPPPAYPPPAYPPPAYAPGTRRSPWYIGFGLGGGDGGLRQGGTSYTFREWNFDQSLTTVVLNFKVGATLSPKLLLGFDVTAIRADTGDSAVIPGATQVSNYDAVATWFPQGEGLFFRGGLGLSVLADEYTSGGIKYSNTVRGGNFLAGVGYAFWIGRTFNLTLDLDYSGQSYSSSDPNAPTSSHFWAAWVGFDWY